MNQIIPNTTKTLKTATRNTWTQTTPIWDPTTGRLENVPNGIEFYRYTDLRASSWIECVDFKVYGGQSSRGTMVVWYRADGTLNFIQLKNVTTLELARVLRGWAVSRAGKRSMGAALHRVRKAVAKRNGMSRQPRQTVAAQRWQRNVTAFHRQVTVDGEQLAAR